MPTLYSIHRTRRYRKRQLQVACQLLILFMLSIVGITSMVLVVKSMKKSNPSTTSITDTKVQKKLPATTTSIKKPTSASSTQTLASPTQRLSLSDALLPTKIPAWNEPSLPSYPSITNPSSLSVKVSIADQRVYIFEGEKHIYTMVCSTGDTSVGNDTPLGQFQIQAERGDKYYFPQDNDYIFNWISFKDHGVYMFHSIIMLDDTTPLLSEAKKLGNQASHGCIRLSLPDSKWFYDTVITGTPVEIY